MSPRGSRDQVLCSHDQLGKAEAAVVLSSAGGGVYLEEAVLDFTPASLDPTSADTHIHACHAGWTTAGVHPALRERSHNGLRKTQTGDFSC